MTEPAERVEQLAQVWASIATLGDELTEDEWKRPSPLPGWCAKDVVVHLLGGERSFMGEPQPEIELPDDLPHIRNPIGLGAERWIVSRRDRSGAEVIAEFRAVTDTRLAQLRSFGPDEFARESWTPVGPGTVGSLMRFRVLDSWVHEQDLRAAVARPGGWDGPAAREVVDGFVRDLPYVVGKRVAASDGTTVVLRLLRPESDARTVTVLVEGGRARIADDGEPADPTVTMEMDAETYVRFVTGRGDPDELLDAVGVRGDADLARRIAHALNVTP